MSVSSYHETRTQHFSDGSTRIVKTEGTGIIINGPLAIVVIVLIVTLIICCCVYCCCIKPDREKKELAKQIHNAYNSKFAKTIPVGKSVATPITHI